MIELCCAACLLVGAWVAPSSPTEPGLLQDAGNEARATTPRAELLELWRSSLASGDIAGIVEEGPRQVARGGELENDAEATALVARALFAAGQEGGARALLAALRLEEDDPQRLHVVLAEASFALTDDLGKVLRLLELPPNDGNDGPRVRFAEEPLAWLLVGRAHARKGSAEVADAFLESFVTMAPLHPEAPSALHLLARHALARRDLERARALRAEAEKRARWHEVYRARAASKRAHPKAAEPRLALAELWRVVGELDRARAELNALLKLQPDNETAKQRLEALNR